MSRPFKNKPHYNARRETLEKIVAMMNAETAAALLHFINDMKKERRQQIKKIKSLNEYKKRLIKNAPRTYPF